MKVSKKTIIIVCLVISATLVMIVQYFICSAPSPKTIGYRDAVQLLQKTEQLENETADIWKSKDGKLIFNTIEDIKNVTKSESNGVYIGDDSIQPIKVLTEANYIQVIGENNSIIFEGYGKYDKATGDINIRCKSNNSNLSTYDINGYEWVDFCLLKSA